MALASGSCVAVLRQVPNQRLYMKNDARLGEKGRSEDDLIAWTWRHFVLFPNQPDWLLRMPMTKAVRLAFGLVDIKIQEEKSKIGSVWKDQFETVDEFTVLGRSKRGWTTWTIAAVDKRVKAAIPIVLDCVNMQQTFSDWYQNLGAWSFAMEPYYSENLTNYFDDPTFAKLQEIVDPYTYRERLTMPKMVVSATGDEFFAPDDSYAWYDELAKYGPTYLRLMPNAEHSTIIPGLPPQKLSSPSIIHGIRAFHLAVHKQFSLPKMSWIRSVDSRGYAKGKI